jgi:hypothetical protein
MIKFNPEFMAEQRELAEKATARPWTCEWNWQGDSSATPTHTAWAESPVVAGDSLAEVGPQAEADKAFAEAAANHYLAALDEIERLRAALANMRDSFNKAICHHNENCRCGDDWPEAD